jgi:DNA-binding beta-propeller fold protein YncE
MKKYHGIAPVLITFVTATLLASSLFAATQPKFVLTPLTPTTLSIEQNETKTVQYQVSNSTKITRTLTMIPIQGIQQIASGAGACTNPFTLSQNQSCTLSLSFTGNALPGNITTGPEICATNHEGDNTPDPFLCSQPSLANSLNITVLPLAPITFVGDSALTLLANGTSTGTMSIQNISGRTIAPGVTAHFEATDLKGIVTATVCGEILNNETCTITFTANRTSISSTSFPIYGTNTASLNGIMTITASPQAYLTNGPYHKLYQCIIDATSGNFTQCQTFSNLGLKEPHGIVINPSKTRAYILNYEGSSVTQCTIDPSTLNLINCENANANGLSNLFNFTLNPAGTVAYIPDSNADKIYKCDINPATGNFDNSCTATSAALLGGPRGIAIDPSNSFAYIANYFDFNVVRCAIDTSGDLSSCQVMYQSKKSDHFSDITMNTSGTLVYIIGNNILSTSTGTGSIQLVCPIDFIGCVETIFSSYKASPPWSVAINAAGTIDYATNSSTDEEYTQFTLNNGFISSYQSYSTLPDNPWGIALIE